MGNPFLLATDFQPTVTYGIISGAHRYQYPCRHAAGIHRLPPDRRLDQSRQLRRAAVRRRRTPDRHQRPRLVREARPRQRRRRLRHFASTRSRTSSATCRAAGSSTTPRSAPRSPSTTEGRVIVADILDIVRRLPPRPALRRRDRQFAATARSARPTVSRTSWASFPRAGGVPVTFRREDRIVETHVRLAGVHTQEDLLKNVQKPPTEQPGLPPAPKEKPSPSKEKDEPSPNERPGLPLPLPNAMTPQPPPPHVAPLIKKRPGYANYYFNELNRNRVWNAFTAHGNFREAAGTWVIAGRASGAGPFEITLGTEQVVGKFPTSQDRVDVRNDLDQQLAPPASGGLLPALHLWQRMLTLGPEQFGETYYLGTRAADQPRRTVRRPRCRPQRGRNAVLVRSAHRPARRRGDVPGNRRRPVRDILQQLPRTRRTLAAAHGRRAARRRRVRHAGNRQVLVEPVNIPPLAERDLEFPTPYAEAHHDAETRREQYDRRSLSTPRTRR